MTGSLKRITAYVATTKAILIALVYQTDPDFLISFFGCFYCIWNYLGLLDFDSIVEIVILNEHRNLEFPKSIYGAD